MCKLFSLHVNCKLRLLLTFSLLFYKDFVSWLQSSLPEMNVPTVWTEERPSSNYAFHCLHNIVDIKSCTGS